MSMSLASTPCCIVPCGFSDDGMPTALQIAAKPYDEATALQVGFAYEQSTDWHTKRPSIRSVEMIGNPSQGTFAEELYGR
jgi:aspartyl-tRNA(Asn)/glutamyl-tRNA(Gln) amidotransferase subunit A